MFIKIVRLASDWKVIEGSKGKFAVTQYIGRIGKKKACS